MPLLLVSPMEGEGRVGKESVSTTPVRSTLPVFLTVIVYVNVVGALISVLSTLFVIVRFGVWLIVVLAKASFGSVWFVSTAATLCSAVPALMSAWVAS